MTTLTEGRHAAEFVISEANKHRSRETVTIDQSQTVAAGALLGLKYTATATPDAGNTGDGTVSAVTIADDNIQVGDYVLTVIATAANGGTFQVIAPDGSRLPDLEVGTAYANHIGLTVNDGAADWALDDFITVAVAKDKYEALDLAGTDGSQIADAVAYSAVTTGASETKDIAAYVRDCELEGDELTYPAGATGAQIATANDQLARNGVIVR